MQSQTPKLGLARQAPEIIDKAYALLTVYWIPRQAELRIFLAPLKGRLRNEDDIAIADVKGLGGFAL